MAILTNLPASVVPGTPSAAITLSPTDLISGMSITDPYWSVSTNWSSVQFNYSDATSNQVMKLLIKMPAVTGVISVSDVARQNVWEVESILIRDFDGGSYLVPRADFPSPAAFDVPVTSGPDPYTSMLLHLDGNGTDSSTYARTPTVTGSVAWAAGEFSQAADFTATNCRINYNSGSATGSLDFESGDFTIDLWAKAATSHAGFIINRWNNAATGDWYLLYFNTFLRFGIVGGPNFNLDSSAVSLADGNFHHIAIVRNGTSFVIYFDGINLGSQTSAAAMPFDPAIDLAIGAISDTFTFEFNGYVDEVRVSKGIARWTSNFTPPNAPYTS